ncbi:ABC transporter substrate-binding protein [Pseudactinotalea sp. Z1748]|uniref:ABC transporter substrate-binding protein n=1 Tax=Pseudactinotalea sp. Z1748 TaxID=3413027 RepID=UPI003C7A3ADF
MKRTRTAQPRLLKVAALAAAGALVLSACGQADNLDDEPAADDDSAIDAEPADDADEVGDEGDAEEVTIRFSWWGSDIRHQMNQDLIDAFQEEYPHIQVQPDYTDWGGYWDKLATQTAGGDAPDVLMQEERYLREYASRGVLANLHDYDIDLSQIDDSLVESGEFDGSLWGIATGVNVRVMIADEQVFADAGVDFPDDTTWTWDAYAEAVEAVSANSEAGVYGTQEFGFIESDLQIWLRQHGQELWDENGDIGFDAELMAERWQMSLDLIESGAAPPATESVERSAAGVEGTFIANHEAGVSTYWTNNLETLSSASGRPLTLMRYPGETEFERTGVFLKPAMALSMAADTDHPEEAALFIDYMLNSETAGDILLSDRGLPANNEVRAQIMDQLSDSEQQAAEFIEEVTPEIVDAYPSPPRGAGEVAAVMARLNEEVLFGQKDPMDAAEEFIAEASEITGD